MKFVGEAEDKLDAIEDDTHMYLGRKKSIHEKYGTEGALLFGKCLDKDKYGKLVSLDAISPHVAFVCGARGSGKSYDLGVMAEELLLRNPNIAAVVIDPVGIFWSMKHPNKEEKEVKDLVNWGLEPNGLENTKVFIPHGVKSAVPKETYDALFSIKPSELTVDDWCLTFNLERFSPTTLLLEKAIDKAKQKYSNYSLDELIKTIEKDKELTSREKGYSIGTRRALLSRLEAAKSWGILEKDGTSLAEVCKEGFVSVIDISFLEENVSSLVIGILARKILNARKRVTRQASMEKYVMTDIDELLDVEIPPTWLFIDEAHTLVPSGGTKTAATDALIEYVKQGRRPGCSLVFATQQPSAINTKVLSQLDILIAHKLIFDEDIKAVMKRVPTVVPSIYQKASFIRSLPIGVGMIADRSEGTSRAFTIKVRPRFSQHEGRETTSIELDEKIDPEQIKKLIVELIYKKMEREGHMSLRKVESVADTLTRRYKIKVKTEDIINQLTEDLGCEVKEGALWISGKLPTYDEETVEGVVSTDISQKALPVMIDEAKAKSIAEKNKKGKKLGLFGKEENIKSMELIYYPAYLVSYSKKSEHGSIPSRCFISHDYELLFNDKKGLEKTQTLNMLLDLSDKKFRVLNELRKSWMERKEVQNKTMLTAQASSKYLRELVGAGLVERKNDKYKAKKLDVPEKIDKSKFSMDSLELVKPKNIHVEDVKVNEKRVKSAPKLFGNMIIDDSEMILLPVWKVVYEAGNKLRTQEFNAL